jgi:hypothetical protein
MMYDAEVIKVAAIVLTALIPLLTAYVAIKREMGKAAQPPTIGNPGVIAIGGALASQGGTLLHVEAMEKQSKSMDIQSEALNRLADANGSLARAHIERTGKISQAIDEMIRLRQAIEDISRQMQRNANSK